MGSQLIWSKAIMDMEQQLLIRVTIHMRETRSKCFAVDTGEFLPDAFLFLAQHCDPAFFGLLVVGGVLSGANGFEEVPVGSQVGQVGAVVLPPVQRPSSEPRYLLRPHVHLQAPLQVQRCDAHPRRRGIHVHPRNHSLVPRLTVPEVHSQSSEQLVCRVELVPQRPPAVGKTPSVCCDLTGESPADVLGDGGCELVVGEHVVMRREIIPALGAPGEVIDALEAEEVAAGRAVRQYHDVQADGAGNAHCRRLSVPSELEVKAMLKGKAPLSLYPLGLPVQGVWDGCKFAHVAGEEDSESVKGFLLEMVSIILLSDLLIFFL